MGFPMRELGEHGKSQSKTFCFGPSERRELCERPGKLSLAPGF
jgi:hypothetical protein